MPGATAHDSDLALWAAEQARLLREERVDQVDLRHVAREIERIGSLQHEALRDRLAMLVTRLVMWKSFPGARLPAWRADIAEARVAIARLLEGSPSLADALADTFVAAYRAGRLRAAAETGFDADLLPEAPPFSLADALDDEFLPIERDLEVFQRRSP